MMNLKRAGALRRALHRLLPMTCALAALLGVAPGIARAAAPAAPPRFDVLEYVVEGNTLLGAETIERAVYPFLGEQKSLDDVEGARAALEKAYRDAGYGTVGVDIPEQRVTAGAVSLQVVSGTVARLRVTGARYFSQDRIVAQVPALAEGEVPNLKDVQQQLASVNRTADRRVTPLLRPGKDAGTTEVDLAVEDRLPLHASVELNNRYSPNTTHTRLLASLRYDNLWQRDHSIALQAQVSPENMHEVKVLSASYTLPQGADSLAFSIVRSDSSVAAGVGSTTVFGKGTIYGVRRQFLLGQAERRLDLLTLGADYKSFEETIDAGTGQGFSTPIHYLPLSLAYVGMREDDGGRWQFGGSLSVALRGLASKESEFADKRFGAQSNFSVLKFDLSREQNLPFGLSLASKAELQFTGQPLISNEQFVAGGVDSVRGYPESTAVGDQAGRGAVELRSPNLARDDWSSVAGLTVHAFAEGARLQLRKPLPQQQARFTLLGAGFGLRLQTRPYGRLALDIGWPLRTVGGTQRGDLLLHAAGSFEF